MKILEKTVKAQKAEERAEESLVMKWLYTAFCRGTRKEYGTVYR